MIFARFRRRARRATPVTVAPARVAPTTGLALSLLALGAAMPGRAGAQAQASNRLLRQPTVSRTSIVFVYGGDLWTVARAGGIARRLTANSSIKRYPTFAPDGKTVAFTGNYDGNDDVYTIPAQGGEPKRLTFHPFPDNVLGWSPDGSKILFRSGRTSWSRRFNKLFTVPVNGGMETELPLPEGGLASYSPDGSSLAYNRIEREFASWKRYRGGEQSYVSIYNIANNTYSEVPHGEETDFYPMWKGDKIYFASDRTGTVNLFSYDLKSKATKQLTRFTDFDVKWPSLGPDAIVFEQSGVLHLLDLATENITTVNVEVDSDQTAARPGIRSVDTNITNFGISPSGARAVFEARGDIFTAPAKKGSSRDLTNTPGVREINPAWSPDARYIAYLSDKSGEYELYIRPQDGSGTETRLTTDGKVYRFGPIWSPDSKALLYSDAANHLWMITLADKKPILVDSSDIGDISLGQWSSDSKWITYTKPNPNQLSGVLLYSLTTKKSTLVTSDQFDNNSPCFDQSGKYLYFASARTFTPDIGAPEINIGFRNQTGLFAIILANDTASPFAPEVDEEKPKPDTPAPQPGLPDAPKTTPPANPAAQPAAGAAAPKPAPTAPAAPGIKIDLDGIQSRIVAIPVPPGNYSGLNGGTNKLLYVGDGTLFQFDLTARTATPLISGVAGYDLNPTATKMMYVAPTPAGPIFGIVDVAPGQTVGAGRVTPGLEMRVDPRQEWQQIFKEAWRLDRDYYYDPNLRGLDWQGVYNRYAPLVKNAASRDDLTYLLNDLQGELNTSHAYVQGAENPQVRQVNVGLLGVDFEAVGNRYRFKKIYAGENWDPNTRSPLTEPGVNVKQGDYLIAVNGQPITTDQNPYAAFQDLAGKTITLTVNSKPTPDGARDVQVRPIASETGLRELDWTETNRKKVELATGGRCGYFYVPDTSTGGITAFGRGLYSQTDKDAVIVDERFNSGGFIPDFFVEKLNRRVLSNFTPRYGEDQHNPGGAIYGPKVILANEWSGSGGDAFPYFFRKAGVGPIIGKRTWGGLVGINGFKPLMDGGGITVPTFGLYSPQDNKWIAENHGIDPDIEVNNTPDKMRDGGDPQLDRALAYIKEQLAKNPPKKAVHPPFPVERTHTSGKP